MDNNKKLFEGLLKADGIEPAGVTESERIAFGEMLDEQSQSKQSKPGLRPDIWGGIMKKRITKFAAAAMILFVAIIGISRFGNLLDGTSVAYGIADAPNILRNAGTIRIHGWMLIKAKNSSGGEKAKVDKWIDIRNGQTRTFGLLWFTDRVAASETIFDGKYLMHLSHFGRDEVSFTELTPFQGIFYVRNMVERFLEQAYITDSGLDEYTRVRQEKIDGEDYDIWQRERRSKNVNIPLRRAVCWISPRSGQIKRFEEWEKGGCWGEDWRLTYAVETDFNIEIPPTTFETTAPVSAYLRNTKETATKEPLQHRTFDLETVNINVASIFGLENGCVIIGWNTKEEGAKRPSEKLFSGLVAGGALPKLPGEICGLRLLGGSDFVSEEQISWFGRHLAVTERDGQFYEWSVYVPTREFPSNGGIRNFGPLIKRNPDGWKDKDNYTGGYLLNSFTVRSHEFDTFVKGAMAELSDDGTAPEHITYDYVLDLVEKIKEATEK